MAAHYGMLRDFRFSDDVDDIRGSALYGVDDDKLGKIDDVIFDHATGTIQYAVVDTGGWLSSKKFLVPADRIHPYTKNTDDFAIDATKQQIEALPPYDENTTVTDAQWTDYDTRQRKAWGGGPVHAQGRQHAQHHAGSAGNAGGHRFRRRRCRPTCPTAWSTSSPTLRPIPARSACVRRDWRRRPRTAASRASPHGPDIPTLAAEEAEDRAAAESSAGAARSSDQSG